MNNLGNIDFNKIMQDISSNNDGKNLDVKKLVQDVSKSLLGNQDPATVNQFNNLLNSALGNLEMFNEPTAPPAIMPNLEELNNGQKIPTNGTGVEPIDDDSDVEDLQPRMRSIRHNLDVTLEDLYLGKTKKFAVNRNRLVKGTTTVKEEKVKLEIPIIPGTLDGREIRFNYQGNEKPGYETGDIVITISAIEHNRFQRSKDTLFTVRNVSLYESYAAAVGLVHVVIEHLNGTFMVLEPDGKPLHNGDGLRKVKGAGMPILKRSKQDKQEYGDLYIRFNLILPDSFNDEEATFKILEKMFPVLEDNKNMTVFKDLKTKQILKKGFDVSGAKIKKVNICEVTPEEMEQLEYESEKEDDEEEEDEEEEDDE